MKAVLIFLCCSAVVSLLAVSVVVPAKPEPSTLYAGEELQFFLSKLSGKQVQLIREGSKKITGKALYVGSTSFAARAGIYCKNFGREESLIRSIGKNIVICGGAPRGTLYGAYEFLERFAGILFLDHHSTFIPDIQKLNLPEKIDLRIKPSFDFRGIFIGQAFGKKKEVFLNHIRFRTRMRENIFWQEQFTEAETAKFGITPVLGSPSPLNTLYFYIREWPAKGMEDALSLDENGKRLRPVNIYGPGHVCFSSSKARKMFAKQMKEYIAKDRKTFKNGSYPLLYNLSLNDSGKGKCVCPGCMALSKKYKAYSGAMLEFINYVADEVAKVYPDIMIQTSAYYFTEKPPVGIAPRKNVTVRVSPIDITFNGKCYTMKPMEHKLNRFSRQNLQNWSKIGNVQMWNYWINYGNKLSNAGIVNAKTICQNLKFYKACKVNYVFSEAQRADCSSFYPLRIFMGYQMQKNCTLKYEDLMEKFFNGYYKKAAKPMRKLYDYIEKRQLEHPHLCIRDAHVLTYLDKEFFRTANRYLAEAAALAGNDQEVISHIRLEKNVLDAARVYRGDSWAKEKYLPQRNEVLEDVRKSWPAVVAYMNDYGSRMKELLPKLDHKKGARYALPETLKGRTDLYEIVSDNFSELAALKNFGLRLIDDPESCNGKAMMLSKLNTNRFKRKLHTRDLSFGIQSRLLKKSLLQGVMRDFNDEKYHLCHLGRVELTPLTVVWFTWSWGIQQDLSRYYRAGGSNVYDVYVSLKVQGPAYITGSQKENAIFIDRFLLVPFKQK